MNTSATVGVGNNAELFCLERSDILTNHHILSEVFTQYGLCVFVDLAETYIVVFIAPYVPSGESEAADS